MPLPPVTSPAIFASSAATSFSIAATTTRSAATSAGSSAERPCSISDCSTSIWLIATSIRIFTSFSHHSSVGISAVGSVFTTGTPSSEGTASVHS